jgi:myo-inositol-1(or 4)-monophosphatase
VCQKSAVREFERVARTAVTRAGALLRSRYGGRHRIDHKGEVDLVTEVDREAEGLIVDTLASAFPSHGIVAEESAPRIGGTGHRWYVDPIDGTTNFAHGYPHFVVSVALGQGDDLLLGLVYDPLREELFSASRGGGAFRNGEPIAVSGTTAVDAALVATGFAYDRRQHADFYLGFVRVAMLRTLGVRVSGSAALDLCWVACGRLDAFWEWKLQPWDTAAGRVILEEAGGRVTDFDGRAHRLDGEQTAASNGRIHDAFLGVLADGMRTPWPAGPKSVDHPGHV